MSERHKMSKSNKQIKKYCECKKFQGQVFEDKVSGDFIHLKCGGRIRINKCETAPYPKCNGAEGCQECEHQKEE